MLKLKFPTGKCLETVEGSQNNINKYNLTTEETLWNLTSWFGLGSNTVIIIMAATSSQLSSFAAIHSKFYLQQRSLLYPSFRPQKVPLLSLVELNFYDYLNAWALMCWLLFSSFASFMVGLISFDKYEMALILLILKIACVYFIWKLRKWLWLFGSVVLFTKMYFVCCGMHVRLLIRGMLQPVR